MDSFGLEVFIQTAKLGSFTKAGEKLYISSTSVMKQINKLESETDVKLFDRTHSGVLLTKAGDVFYKRAKEILSLMDLSIKEAKAEENKKECTLKIGTSLLNPCKVLLDIWSQLSFEYPMFKIQIIPFEDDRKNILKTIGDIGKRIDFIAGACDSGIWLEKCDFYHLGYYDFALGIPKSHRLSKKSIISFDDLKGEKLFIVKEGDSRENSALKKELEINYPEIKIEEVDYFYDIDVFNRCVEENTVLMSLSGWKDVHPSMVTVPLKEQYKIPFGILYSKNPSDGAKKFLDIIKQKYHI